MQVNHFHQYAGAVTTHTLVSRSYVIWMVTIESTYYVDTWMKVVQLYLLFVLYSNKNNITSMAWRSTALEIYIKNFKINKKVLIILPKINQDS